MPVADFKKRDKAPFCHQNHNKFSMYKLRHRHMNNEANNEPVDGTNNNRRNPTFSERKTILHALLQKSKDY